MKLYEYDEIIDSLLNTDEGGADAQTGLVFDPALLDRLEMERNEKIENLLLYAAQLETDAKDIGEYADKLSERAKAKKNKAESIREWLCGELLRYGDKKFETKRIKATVTVRSKVNVLDESLVPEQYLRTKTETSPDKKALLAAMKAGEVIAGVTLIDNPSLQIK